MRDISLDEAFEDDYTLRFHLSLPCFSGIDPATGRPRKRGFGPVKQRAMEAAATRRKALLAS